MLLSSMPIRSGELASGGQVSVDFSLPKARLREDNLKSLLPPLPLPLPRPHLYFPGNIQIQDREELSFNIMNKIWEFLVNGP